MVISSENGFTKSSSNFSRVGYIHFDINALRKCMYPSILPTPTPAIGQIAGYTGLSCLGW